ncbi:hypothetical protein [Aeromonas phage AS-yj]|uniref:Uncharacterized protein n=1 Tax=Aeromonas phage AS-yj TaxID=2026115 RepID=A0A291LF07_9CAUD|nr:hypothetical protein [Aeromonas phage AS-yj]QAX98985.1 hypothetical protein assk_194 [Aeromonas phage Assk]
MSFENDVKELIRRFDNSVPPPLRVGVMKKSDTVFEIAVVDPFGQPIQIFTVYEYKDKVYYCHGQQYKSPEKDIN